MILVRIRHKRCMRVLAEISHRPPDWDGSFTFLMCGKCERPSPRRTVEYLIAQDADAIPLAREITWAELRPFIDSALKRGRTVDVVT